MPDQTSRLHFPETIPVRQDFAPLAAKLGAETLGEQDVVATQVLGCGTVNEVFLIEGSTGRVIVRLNAEPHRVDEFSRERTAMGRARAHGVYTAEVLRVGRLEDVSYQVQSFVEGTHPAHSDLRAWEELGEVIRRVHEVAPDPANALVWKQQLEYGLNELGPTDPLQRLGLFDSHRSAFLLDAWAPLGALKVGLCHGDVSMRNVIIEKDDRLVLLDWGCTAFGVVPFFDVADVVGELDPEGASMTAFLNGYGTSWSEVQETMALTATLKAVDLCRWALDRHPAELPRCIRQARWAFSYYLDGATWRRKPAGGSPIHA